MNGSDKIPGKKYSCPIERTFAIIGSKWTVLILRELSSGTKRFGQLRDSLRGISPKTLTQRLRELEKDGIVHKTSYPEIPPRVEYRLTTRGESLRTILTALARWGAENLEDKTSSCSAACRQCPNSPLCGQYDREGRKGT